MPRPEPFLGSIGPQPVSFFDPDRRNQRLRRDGQLLVRDVQRRRREKSRRTRVSRALFEEVVAGHGTSRQQASDRFGK